MNCRECATFLDEYFDGTLEQATRASFEFHLSRCANCERYLESYRATLTLERSAFDDGAAGPDIPEDLVRAILDARKSRTRRPD
jgi:anti-sigma factor RsiW